MTNTVYVSSSGVEALSQPEFIIKVGNVLYLTRAVWEYDYDHAITPEQLAGVPAMAAQFDALPGPDLVARQRPGGPGGGGDPSQTFPP